MSDFSLTFSLPDLDFSPLRGRKEISPKQSVLCAARVLPLMDILACRSEENSYNILPSAATMLFHSLPGGDVHGVVEEMDRRGKGESAAISSAIDMGESETVGSGGERGPHGLGGAGSMGPVCSALSSALI